MGWDKMDGIGYLGLDIGWHGIGYGMGLDRIGWRPP